MSAQDGIPEKGSLLDDINEFGKLVNDLAVSLGREPACKPITLRPIKVDNLLAEWDCMITDKGSFMVPVTVRVYGEILADPYAPPTRYIENMRVTINGSEVELGEEIENEIANQILSE